MGLFKTAVIGYAGFKVAKEGTSLIVNLVYVLAGFVFSFAFIPLYVYSCADSLESNTIYYLDRAGNKTSIIKKYALITLALSALLCISFLVFNSAYERVYGGILGHGAQAFIIMYLLFSLAIPSWVFFYYRKECSDLLELHEVFEEAKGRIESLLTNDKQEIYAMKKNKLSNDLIVNKIEEKASVLVKNFSDYISINRLLTEEEKSQVGKILKPQILQELDVEYKEGLFKKLFS